jgi:RHS repeat-associated protein
LNAIYKSAGRPNYFYFFYSFIFPLQHFSADENGNITNLARYGNTTAMDSMTYKYVAGTNKLNHVRDNTGLTSNYSVDVDNQSANNYDYTAIGELTEDASQQITDIEWRVDGKVKKITRSGSSVNQIEFEYDAFGRRIMKLVKPVTSGVVSSEDLWTVTYYVNDAHGNIMSVYEVAESSNIETFTLSEQYIYGAGTIGSYEPNTALATFNETGNILTENAIDLNYRRLGEKKYILQNQVSSNMLAVSDRFVPHNNSGTIDYFTAAIISENDYYPFGMLMPGRNNTPDAFRNGFQNQQKDDEIFGMSGSLVSAEYWEYDTRLGRRWNMDPLAYASQSCYAAFNNNPVIYSDPMGLKGGGGSGPPSFMATGVKYGAAPKALSGLSKGALAVGVVSVSQRAQNTLTEAHLYGQNNYSETTTSSTNSLAQKGKMIEQSKDAKDAAEWGEGVKAGREANAALPTIKDATSDEQKMANYQLDKGTDLIPFVPIGKKWIRGEKITISDWIIEGICILPIGKIAGKTIKWVTKAGKPLVSETGQLITKGLKRYKQIGKFDDCIKFAKDFMDTFKEIIEESGGTVQRMQMNVPKGKIGTPTQMLAENGIHQYVEVTMNGKHYIYDSYFSDGMLKEEYMNLVEGMIGNTQLISGKALMEKASPIK